MVQDSEFRHDFYHRLNVVNIRLPSLTERREDIPALTEHFVDMFAKRYERNIQGFDNVSMRRLYDAEWSGNIRELKNAIERCVILADGPILKWPDQVDDSADTTEDSMNFPQDSFPSLDELEQEYINHVLRHADGKKTRAAQILGIDKTTLWRKLRRYEEEQG
jgi:DNA-binding NtrC family response regulator